MYDPTFNTKTINQLFVRFDFRKDGNLKIDSYKNDIIKEVIAKSQTGFGSLVLKQNNLKGKSIYQTSSLSDELVFRKLDANIRRITGVWQSNRSKIIHSIRALCCEGLKFRIYKIDINKFYESINRNELLKSLEKDISTSPTTLNLMRLFFKNLENNNINGLPRGMAISASLSEYLMRSFDLKVSMRKEVFYYARYVDDIFIVTSSSEEAEDFKQKINDLLPDGLSFNQGKTYSVDLLSYDKKNKKPIVEKTIDYLGYKFSIYNVLPDHNDKKTRHVCIDLSDKKVKKIKSRIILSARQFLIDGNFNVFEARIRLLTGNYTFFDHRKNMFRKSGIFYDYPLIDADSSIALKEIDIFLKKMILSKNGKQFGLLCRKLNEQQKTKLLTYSIGNGFKNKVHFCFSATKLEDIMRCWKYV